MMKIKDEEALVNSPNLSCFSLNQLQMKFLLCDSSLSKVESKEKEVSARELRLCLRFLSLVSLCLLLDIIGHGKERMEENSSCRLCHHRREEDPKCL